MQINPLAALSARQLKQAANIRARIEQLETQLAALLTTDGTRPAPALKPRAPAAGKRPKRQLTTAGRAKLRASAKARWAKAKAAGKSRL